ncbi:MAG: hypothetical protein HGA67_00685 [Candidatus Yonathbacteria bacterium]|nr:hypothetical protein [Candidatus Yonathbacteria bacterium]
MYRERPFLIGVSLAFVLLVLFVVVSSGVLYAWADAHLLVPRAETFTELSLNVSPDISIRSANAAKVSFSFLVTNHEEKGITYSYTIIRTSVGKESNVLKKGTVYIDSGRSVSLHEEFSLRRPLGDDRIDIALFGGSKEKQELHFYLIPTR